MQSAIAIHTLGDKLGPDKVKTVTTTWQKMKDIVKKACSTRSLAVTRLTVYRQLQVPAQVVRTQAPPGTNVWRKDARAWNSQDPSNGSGWRVVPESIWYLSWFPPGDIAVASLSSELVTKTNPNLTTIWYEIQYFDSFINWRRFNHHFLKSSI